MRWLGLVVLAACRFNFDELSLRDGGGDSGTIDPATPWGAPVAVGIEIRSDFAASSNLLELYHTAGSDPVDVSLSTRTTATDPWSAPQSIAVNTGLVEVRARLSLDDRTLYFGSNRTGNGDEDIYYTTRANVGDPWPATAQLLAEVSSTADDKFLSLCKDDYYVIGQQDAFGERLYEGQLGVQSPTEIAALNTGTEGTPYLSHDCLTLYFKRDVGGAEDLFMSRRSAPGAAWGAAVPLDEVNGTTSREEDPWVSEDGRVLLFASSRNTGFELQLFQATR